jgi:hypothetical protein
MSLEQQQHNCEEQHLNTSLDQQEHEFGTIRTQRKKITRMQTWNNKNMNLEQQEHDQK